MHPNQALQEESILNPNNNESYVIKELIAEGGFSFIYEADMVFYTHSTIGKREVARNTVVLKELFYPDLAKRKPDSTEVIWGYDPKELGKRLKAKTLSEASKLNSLKSKHIVYIYSAFELNNTVYIVMRKIQNAISLLQYLNLDDKSKKEQLPLKPLGVEEGLKYFRQVCEALQEVHDKNIIHLDIKPENILISTENPNEKNATLIDFGISVSLINKRASTLLFAAESKGYSPPEQNREDKITFATDIYALGCTLYFSLTGKKVPDSLDRYLKVDVENPSIYNEEISPYLEKVILKSINLEIEKRYQSVREFLDAINGEEKYKLLLDEVKEDLANQNFNSAIEKLQQTEQFIPYTEEVVDLLKTIRLEYQLATEKEEFDRLVAKVDLYLENKEYGKALGILQTLSPTKEVEEKIKLAEEELKKQTILHLRKRAQVAEDTGNLAEAIKLYQEIKVLSPGENTRLNQKIDNLVDRVTTEKKYHDHILAGDEYFSKEGYQLALHEFLQAKKIKVNETELNLKINLCEERLEAEKAYKEALKEAGKMEKLNSLTDNQLAQLESWTKKYPKEEYILSIFKTKNDQNLRDKAEKEFKNQNYETADSLFNLIQEKTDSDDSYLSEIATHQKIVEAKNGLEKAEYEKSINLLSKIPDTSSFSTRARELLNRAYYLQGQKLHREGQHNDAERIFSKVKAEPGKDAAQYLLFYQAQEAFSQKDYVKAEEFFSQIKDDTLKEEATSYLEQIDQNSKTILLDDEIIEEEKAKINDKNWDGAIKRLSDITNPGSHQHSKAQELKHTEENGKHDDLESENYKYLTEAKEMISQGSFDEAKILLNKISNSSYYYKEAETLRKRLNKPKLSLITWIVGGVIGLFAFIILIGFGDDKTNGPTIEEEDIAKVDSMVVDSMITDDVIIPEPIEKKDTPEPVKKTKETVIPNKNLEQQTQRAERERIAREQAEQLGRYTEKLNEALRMFRVRDIETCKSDPLCRNHAIRALNEALKIYPEGTEAKKYLKQLEN